MIPRNKKTLLNKEKNKSSLPIKKFPHTLINRNSL